MTQAIVLSKDGETFKAEVRAISEAELEAATPGDDVVVAVEYSTINLQGRAGAHQLLAGRAQVAHGGRH